MNDYGFLIYLYFPTETDRMNGGGREGIVKGSRGQNGERDAGNEGGNEGGVKKENHHSVAD